MMNERAKEQQLGLQDKPTTSLWTRVISSLGAGIGTALLSGMLATQFFASHFRYHSWLGNPLEIANVRLYAPWSWLTWSWKVWPSHSSTISASACVFFTSFTIIAGSISFRRSRRKRRQKYADLHGSARFASRKEILSTGLLNEEHGGVYVGGYRDEGAGVTHYLQHNGPEHVIVFAPTRSGKGVGIVIPTLLAWSESALILDIKGENWALTAGWRKHHANNEVLRFDPTSRDSVRYNPLDAIRIGTDREVADAQNVTQMLLDPDGKGMNDHWRQAAFGYLVGVLLHCIYIAREKGEKASLASVGQFMDDPSKPMVTRLEEMLHNKHLDGNTHPTVAAAARAQLDRAEEERTGVHSTAKNPFQLYADPVIARNVSTSDFMVSDLMNHERPVSLYLVISPADKDRLRPLTRLVTNQIVRTLSERMEFQGGRSVKHYKHRLLLMLDEFPSLGCLNIFEESLAFIAGYGMKAVLIVQDLAQLQAQYGQHESITSNCHIRVVFAPNKPETAEFISKMSGTQTVVKDSLSMTRKAFAIAGDSVSESVQEVQRPLLTVDECMRLPAPQKDTKGNITQPGHMLIFVAGHRPIYGEQILYFKDEVFAARAAIPAPEKSDSLTTKSDESKSSMDLAVGLES